MPSHSFDSLDRKLMEVELSHAEKIKKKHGKDIAGVDAKIMEYQKKYEQQAEKKFQVEMERFRDTQLANMRIDERENYQREISRIRSEYEEEYKKKVKLLSEREAKLIERADEQDKKLEKDSYDHRQQILRELETVKLREAEMKNTHNIALKNVEIDSERLRVRMEQVRLREEAAKNTEERFEHRLQEHMLRTKMEIEEDNRSRMNQLREQEQQLKEDKMSFQAQREAQSRMAEDLDHLRSEYKLNEDALAAAKQTISALNQKVVVMQDRLQECSDYFELRTRNQVLVKENHQTKRNLTEQMKEKEKREKEHQRLVKELLKKMSKTSPDVEVLRENVTREVEERERKESELQGKITGLQERFNLEVWVLYF
jgi:hypothetical protein